MTEKLTPEKIAQIQEKINHLWRYWNQSEECGYIAQANRAMAEANRLSLYLKENN